MIGFGQEYSDQTIEQVVTRESHRSATQARAIHTLLGGILMLDSLEGFCNVHAQKSDQDHDLRPASTEQDHQHMMLFKH